MMFRTTAIALVTLLAAVPATADVKAGITAWQNGNYKKAVSEWRGPAERGDPDAEFNLAQAYRLGRGVTADQIQAEAWYAKAAAQGHQQAQDNYGLTLFRNGKRAEALPWLKRSSQRGEPRAQFVLGTMYFNGDTVEKDWPRAYALMSRSAASGLPQASSTLTEMDRYITLADRQKGTELARQYESASSAQVATAAPPTGQSTSPSAPHYGTPVAEPGLRQSSINAAKVPPSSAYRPQPPAPAAPTPPLPARAAATNPVVRPAVPARPTAVAADTGPWRVQLGAFGNAANARRLGQSFASRFSGKRVIYEKAGRLTKVQIGGFATEHDADRACVVVKSRGKGCLTIAP